MKKIVVLIIATLLLGSSHLLAQPSWSVTPSNFQYNGNITGKVTIQGTEFRDAGGIVGAFCGGECRGVSNLQYVASIDKYLVFLTIYSNNATGDQITFRFYNNQIDFIHDVNNTVAFTVNMTLGNLAAPYEFEALPANSNTRITVNPGFENVVKNIGTNIVTVAPNITTSQLQPAIKGPTDQYGTVVGTFVIRYTATSAPVPIDATVVDESMEVFVTAQDQSTKTYSIAIGNANVDLATLTVSAGTLDPAFDPGITQYNLVLPYGDPIPQIDATCADANSTRVITQAGSIPGVASVVVTAEDHVTTKTYSVNISYAANTDATLQSLSISVGTLDPQFAPDLFTYDGRVPWGTTDVPVITAVPTDAAATVDISYPATIPGQASVLVTADDQTTQQTYLVNFDFAPNTDATLASLTLKSGTLVPAFDPGTVNYQVELPVGTETAPEITAIATDAAHATVTQHHPDNLPGEVLVEVVAMDQTTILNYRIQFNWDGNQDATLSSISINGIAIPGFSSDNRSYDYMLQLTEQGIPPVTATTTDPLASYELLPPEQVPGDLVIMVYAENYSIFRTYSIHLQLNPDDATLCEIQIDGNPLDSFDPLILQYVMDIQDPNQPVPVVSGSCTNPDATVTVTQADNLNGMAVLHVTASGGAVTNDYEVRFSETSGIETAPLKKLITKVYPNPNRGAFSLVVLSSQLDEIELSVIDLTGKELMYKKVNGAGLTELSLELQVNPGIYLLKICVNDRVDYQKIVIR